MSKHYWKMEEGGEILGPTFGTNPSDLFDEIASIMGVDKLPDSFTIVEECGIEIKQRARNRNAEDFGKILLPLKSKYKFTHDNYRISPKYGSYIDIDLSHRSMRFGHNTKFYRYDNPKDVEFILKEIEKRLKNRIETIKNNKMVEGRTTTIGNKKYNTSRYIQEAVFQIYLDVDEDIANAEPTLTGYVKFFSRPKRRVIFDIDNRKILSIKGEELQASNKDIVLDDLIKYLAEPNLK